MRKLLTVAVCFAVALTTTGAAMFWDALPPIKTASNICNTKTITSRSAMRALLFGACFPDLTQNQNSAKSCFRIRQNKFSFFLFLAFCWLIALLVDLSPSRGSDTRLKSETESPREHAGESSLKHNKRKWKTQISVFEIKSQADKGWRCQDPKSRTGIKICPNIIDSLSTKRYLQRKLKPNVT